MGSLIPRDLLFRRKDKDCTDNAEVDSCSKPVSDFEKSGIPAIFSVAVFVVMFIVITIIVKRKRVRIKREEKEKERRFNELDLDDTPYAQRNQPNGPKGHRLSEIDIEDVAYSQPYPGQPPAKGNRSYDSDIEDVHVPHDKRQAPVSAV